MISTAACSVVLRRATAVRETRARQCRRQRQSSRPAVGEARVRYSAAAGSSVPGECHAATRRHAMRWQWHAAFQWREGEGARRARRDGRKQARMVKCEKDKQRRAARQEVI